MSSADHNPESTTYVRLAVEDIKESDDVHEISGSVLKPSNLLFSPIPNSSIVSPEQLTKPVRSRKCKCSVRGCYWLFWIIAAFLLAGGLWSCWVWTLLLWGNPDVIHFISDLAPSSFILSNGVAFFLCWLIPIFCGLYLIFATIWNSKKLSRCYYIITSWLLILPIVTILYYVVYLGKLSPHAVGSILKKRISEYNEETDALKWNELQTNLNCCGVNGWKDWVDSDSLNGAVPPSCCKNYKNYATNGCPHKPSNDNTLSEGCLKKVLAVHSNTLITAIVTLSCVTLLMAISIFAATRFYNFFERGTNPELEFRFTCTKFWQDCMLPCCLKSRKNARPRRRRRKELYRTTEHAFMHHVEHRGPPLTYKRQFAAQFSIV